ENAKDVQYPFKSFNQRYAEGNKYYSEYHGHHNTEEQHAAIMFFFDAERGKDKDEDKNIINAQAPFKQVSAEIFECRLSSHFNEYKNKECHSKAHPKKSLIEGLLYRDGLILFAQQSQVKHQSQY